MSKINLCFISLNTAIVIVAVTMVTQAGDRGRSSFADRVAGTYIEDGSIGFGPFTGLHTIGADGTHVAINNESFGNGNPSETGPQSPFHGVWEQTGPRQITLTTYIFVLDPLGNFAVWARPTAVLDFDEDFETAEGTLTTMIYLPFQDPTDPEEMEIFSAQGTSFMKRVPVIDPCL